MVSGEEWSNSYSRTGNSETETWGHTAHTLHLQAGVTREGWASPESSTTTAIL
jgi:hypothetical protein